MSTKYVPEIQVEFEKVELEKVHDTESISSSTDSDEEKKNMNVKLVPRAHHLLRLDSGSSIGEEEDPAEITDEIREKIVAQAEYYFSDENLKKDGFLLKHVKRNKEGFVNLKLLASFKKMRSLSRDYRVIGEALKDSKQLVVNETGLKLRRVTPLPKELLDQVRVKHIVLTNIPHENPSMNYVTEAFENHKDDVVSVRIIKPGKKFPNDLQSHFSRHPELREEIVAVVEFENPDVANEAFKTAFSGKYEGLTAKLLELGPKQAKRIGSTGNSDLSAANDSDSAMERRSSQKGKRNSRLLEVSGAEDYPSSASDTEFSAFSSCNRRYNRSRGNSPSTSPTTQRREFSDSNNNSRYNSKNNSRNPSPSVSPKTSPKNPRKNSNKNGERKQSYSNSHKLSPLVNGTQKKSPSSSPEFERRNKSRGNSFNEERRTKSRGNSFNEDSKESSETRVSPWMQRRMMLSESLKNTANTTSSLRTGSPQLEIIRQPKGPDGSMGFSNHPLKKYVLVHAY